MAGNLMNYFSTIRTNLDTVPKKILTGLLAVLILVMGFVTVHRAVFSKSQRSDVTVYIAAGQAVWNGTDIYKAQNARGWLYVYPPPFALVCALLALVPVWVSVLGWYLMALGLLAWAMHLCIKMVTGKNQFWLYFLAFVFIAPAFIQNTAEGQASILMLWLVTGAICWEREGRNIHAALCLAGAILLKAFPVALLAFYLWRRRWRFIVWTLGAVLVGGLILPAIFFGWQRNLTYWKEWTTIVAGPSLGDNAERAASQLNGQLLDFGKRDNYALPAILWRVTHREESRLIANGLGLIMAVIMLLVAGWQRKRNELWIISAGLVWLLLILPVSQLHYHLLLLLPVTMLVSQRKSRPVQIVLIGYAIANLVTLPWSAAQNAGIIGWAMLALWGALVVLAATTETPRE